MTSEKKAGFFRFRKKETQPQPKLYRPESIIHSILKDLPLSTRHDLAVMDRQKYVLGDYILSDVVTDEQQEGIRRIVLMALRDLFLTRDGSGMDYLVEKANEKIVILLEKDA